MPLPVAAAIIGSAAIGAATSVYGASKSSSAAKKAAAAQLKATNATIKQQEAALERQIGLQEPFRATGVNALADYATASQYTPFGMSQFEADPGYQFRMSEGMKALERSAAARGILQSGGTLKDITRFGQDMASHEYQNAFQRYLAERQAKLQPLEYRINLGQAAASGQAANVGSTAGTVGNLTVGAGDIRAQNAITQGNIWSGLASNIGNIASQAATGYGQYQAGLPYQNFLRSITSGSGGYVAGASPTGSPYDPRFISTSFGGPK
jgi:hypothetical protein